MQQLAESPAQHQPQPIPYGLVSLWDMINFSVASYIYQLRTLELMERRVRAPHMRNALSLAAPQQDDAWSETARAVSQSIEATKSLISPLDSHILAAQIQSLEVSLKYGGEYSQEDIGNQIATIIRTITAELGEHFFYHYPRDKGRLLKRTPSDWSAVIAAFPKAEEDIKAAVDCYALGHNHASIYHSMMVLEHGLPALAKRLKAPFNPNKSTWADLTRSIVDQIGKERTKMASSPKGTAPLSRSAAKRKSDILDSCAEAAIEFKFFADIWRNHVMHGRASYDENDAKKVLEHVRAFMEITVTKLKLKGA